MKLYLILPVTKSNQLERTKGLTQGPNKINVKTSWHLFFL